MTRVLVLYHSMYGHIETMAKAVAEGAGRVSGPASGGNRRQTGGPLEGLRRGSSTQGAASFRAGRARGVCPAPAAARPVLCRWG